MSLDSVVASSKVLELLKRLHAASNAQESSFSLFLFWIRKRLFPGKTPWTSRDEDFMRDKFIALESDKSQFIYMLARSSGALNIVEAGTSFGVSTIYLALAAGQNAKALGGSTVAGQGARVIATEYEPQKANKAREHWKEAGDEVEPWITLLEGDLQETLAPEVNKLDRVDILLLDSMFNAFCFLWLHCYIQLLY